MPYFFNCSDSHQMRKSVECKTLEKSSPKIIIPVDSGVSMELDGTVSKEMGVASHQPAVCEEAGMAGSPVSTKTEKIVGEVGNGTTEEGYGEGVTEGGGKEGVMEGGGKEGVTEGGEGEGVDSDPEEVWSAARRKYQEFQQSCGEYLDPS